MFIKDKINTAFKTVEEVKGPVVAKVARSIKGNIMVTTMDEYSAKLLADHIKIWEQAVEGMHVQRHEIPGTWIKLVAHKVPITALTNLATKFREECKVYNSVETLGAVRWLTKPEDKRFASVVFAVPSEAEKWKCQRYGLRIAGTKVNVVNY